MDTSWGVLYIVWGSRLDALLQRSIDSLQKHHPELPFHVERLPDETDPFSGLLRKSGMAEMSPFRNTLFLDADTVVLGRLDFGFRQAERHGLACTICECPWACRYGGLQGDIVEYNTGVLFFTPRSRGLFDAWKRHAASVDSSIRFVRNGQPQLMPYNDQAGFAQAVAEADTPPAVLPLNWNFRPQWHRTFFGPVRIWHDFHEVPPEFFQLNSYYAQPNSIIQYHAFQQLLT